MDFFKKISLVFFSLILTFVILEFSLRLFEVKLPKESDLYFNYSNEVLDRKKPFKHANNGGNCIREKFAKKMQWNPRFGWNDKDVDIDCINKLFNEGKKNIVFMGGSVMANYESPNYLTSIENYVFLNDDRFRSINLAESGARMSNELSIFLETIPKLKKKPDLIIFFDGYNEFNSIRYGGDPIDDFYWSLSVKKRIHNPIYYYFDVLIDRFLTFRLIYSQILRISSSRIQPSEIENRTIIEAANDYTYRKNITKKLCEVYNIDCIFVLQPVFVLTKNINSKTDIAIKKWHNKYFNNDKKVYQVGYNEIIKSNNDIVNLSNIFDNQPGIYFDYVHSNKVGSKIIGESLRKIIIEKFN